MFSPNMSGAFASAILKMVYKHSRFEFEFFILYLVFLHVSNLSNVLYNNLPWFMSELNLKKVKTPTKVYKPIAESKHF